MCVGVRESVRVFRIIKCSRVELKGSRSRQTKHTIKVRELKNSQRSKSQIKREEKESGSIKTMK